MTRLWCLPAPHSCRRNRDFILRSCWATPDSPSSTSLSLRETSSRCGSIRRYSGANNVFLDPSSPVTTYSISDNGTEHVATETATGSLTSALSWRLISHLRLQYSRDLQWSESNSNSPLTRIPGIIDGFGGPPFCPARPANIASTRPKLSAAKARGILGSSAATPCSRISRTFSLLRLAESTSSIRSKLPHSHS